MHSRAAGGWDLLGSITEVSPPAEGATTNDMTVSFIAPAPITDPYVQFGFTRGAQGSHVTLDGWPSSGAQDLTWLPVPEIVDPTFGDGGLYEIADQPIGARALVATPEGLVPPPLAEPGDELIGCWFERDDLHCSASFRRDLESGGITIHLDGAAGSGIVTRDLVPALTAETVPMFDLAKFFPLTIELRATLSGGPERTARIRLLDPSELPQSRRVYVDAN